MLTRATALCLQMCVCVSVCERLLMQSWADTHTHAQIQEGVHTHPCNKKSMNPGVNIEEELAQQLC